MFFVFHNYTAVAALRCFRILRYLWYFELFAHEDTDEPEKEWFSMIKACQLCLFYLEQLGVEFLSKKSKGGAVVLALFFYVTYIFCVFWISTEHIVQNNPNDFGNSCNNLKSCYITLLRLAFYDGSGLDYFQSVVNAGMGKERV